MAIDPTILGLSIGGVVLLVVILFLTGSTFLSIIMVLILLGILIYVLNLIGVISITTKDNTLSVNFMETSPAPVATKTITTSDATATPIQQKEVYYISGNYYTYEEAPAVCASYEGELATYDQVVEAHASGAEWCGYGWTAGGMALFPTQESTWSKLMSESDEDKRTRCGRPGVNGGYFDPNTKMGVNCYGVKPPDKGTKFPVPVPGTDVDKFNNLVKKFKSMTNAITVSPFNRTTWSGSTLGMITNTPQVTK